MASVSGWQLDRVSPAGGSVAGTIVITLYGAGLDLLSQVIYRPKYLNKPLRVLSPTEAQVDFPCADLGVGAHEMFIIERGKATVYDAIEGGGLPLACHSEPRHDGLLPFIGPSWAGMDVQLTTTLYDAERCGVTPLAERYKCSPPPYDALDLAALPGNRIRWARTAEVARCRWVCAKELNCVDLPVDAIGPVRNVSTTSVTCVVPASLTGHVGRVEVRAARAASAASAIPPTPHLPAAHARRARRIPPTDSARARRPTLRASRREQRAAAAHPLPPLPPAHVRGHCSNLRVTAASPSLTTYLPTGTRARPPAARSPAARASRSGARGSTATAR